jgi:hypothetical protein
VKELPNQRRNLGKGTKNKEKISQNIFGCRYGV